MQLKPFSLTITINFNFDSMSDLVDALDAAFAAVIVPIDK
jgi:hypothetical protein